jgi:RND superfamily putative drug exporter
VAAERTLGGAERAFRALGRFVAHHPWYPIVFWVVLLLVAAPFLSRVGSVTNNSASALPSDAPSQVAAAQIAREFPGPSGGSDSLLLFIGPNITSPASARAILSVDRAVGSDRNLTHVGSVDSLYTTYASYLEGQAELASGAILIGQSGTPSATAAINESAALLWGVPALFLSHWQAYGASHSGTPPSSWNAPAESATAAALGGNSTELAVLGAFYGATPTAPGFNGTNACALLPAQVSNCTDAAVNETLGPLLPSLAPSPAAQVPARVALATLGVGNFSSWPSVQSAAAHLIGAESGLPGGFVALVWTAFPHLPATPGAAAAWANGIVATGDLSTYPLPIPGSISSQFLAPDGAAEVTFVTYTVASDYTDANGTNVVAADVAELDHLVPNILRAAGAAGTLTYYQTGGGPLDTEETQVLTSSLGIVLPLTILVLLGITIAYFRAPLAPLLTFGGLGIALGLGVAAVVLIGTLVTHVDVTSIELEETFVLGIGTDYSIFLVSRYREELYRGVDRREAVVTSVTWAGQSVATSGATAVLATLALTFSGVALLSQWGMVLSLAIFITVMISLTIVPAFLVLLGGRVFWPYTGSRFERQAKATQARVAAGETYFFRAGRWTQRRPFAIIAVILVVSVPLVLLAVNVPVSYDFYDQLPSNQSASAGLQKLQDHFGGGFATPLQVLLVFSSPLVVGNVSNATEFTALATLGGEFANTSGVHALASPVGPTGAPLATWLALPRLPPAQQTNLQGILSNYVGVDGRSVLVTVVTAASGLSYSAVSVSDTLHGEVSSFESSHTSLTGAYFGGGPPTIGDLEAQTALATERMLLYVSIGLLVVLFVALRSWLIPILAVGTIALSLSWAWGLTNLVLREFLGIPLFFFVPTILFIIILGLGIDYNIFLLTRVREERVKGGGASGSVVRAVGSTGGIITAAAVILASAFAVLASAEFLLLRAIGFAVAVAVLLDAMVVRTYLVPAALQVLGDRAWKLYPFQRSAPSPTPTGPPPP